MIASANADARGAFVVIDGPDGSGKGTQTALLVQRLRNEGHVVEQLSFPRYGTPEAFFVEEYLNGRYGTAAEVGAKRASLFFALERYHASHELREWLHRGVTVIADRYVSANKGHQMAKITDPDERRAFLSWINDLEYGICGIPKPDLTVLLHVPAETAFALIAQKDERGYLDGKKRDIHEADLAHLQAAEQAYLELPQLDPTEHWRTIECTEHGTLQSIERIHETLYQLVQATLTAHRTA